MVGAVPFVLVLALGVAQGGFFPDTWVWATPLGAWAAALVAVAGDRGGALRRHWPWAAVAAALLAWTAASALWSLEPAQSLLEARRSALYLTVALALLALARRHSARTLVVATHAAISLLLLYALARFLLGGATPQPELGGMLAQPLGYANALGILATLGILLGIGVAARSGSAVALATLPALALALWLSESRGSTLALAAGAAVVVLLDPAPALLRTIAIAAAASAPPVAIAAALDAPQHGALVAAFTAVCAIGAALAARGGEPGSAGRARLPRRVLLALGAAAIAAAAAGAAYTGAAEPRASYWSVAWRHEVLAHPLLGTGAGTFGSYWLRFGDPARWQGALDAHSLYLETLGELGPVGLLLVAALLLLPLRRLGARLGPLGPAAAGAYVAFLVHAGLDWDWEMPAVVVAGLACGAALLLGDETQPGPPPTRARAALAAAALALGGYGIAGVRSDTVPSAHAKAPTSGAFASVRRPDGAERTRPYVRSLIRRDAAGRWP